MGNSHKKSHKKEDSFPTESDKTKMNYLNDCMWGKRFEGGIQSALRNNLIMFNDTIMKIAKNKP